MFIHEDCNLSPEQINEIKQYFVGKKNHWNLFFQGLGCFYIAKKTHHTIYVFLMHSDDWGQYGSFDKVDQFVDFVNLNYTYPQKYKDIHEFVRTKKRQAR